MDIKRLLLLLLFLLTGLTVSDTYLSTATKFNDVSSTKRTRLGELLSTHRIRPGLLSLTKKSWDGGSSKRTKTVKAASTTKVKHKVERKMAGRDIRKLIRDKDKYWIFSKRGCSWCPYIIKFGEGYSESQKYKYDHLEHWHNHEYYRGKTKH